MVNGGATINLLPGSILVKLGKIVDQLIKANIVVTDFTGKTSISKGMIMLNVRDVDRITPFVVVASRVGYNTLLGREWIHGAGVVPSTFHQKFEEVLRNVEEVYAYDSPYYLQQAHVDFKVYSPKVKPILVDTSTCDFNFIGGCYFGPNGFYFMPKAEIALAKKET